jgi:Kef-type K+ transport system membrane component KefB
LNFLEQLKTSVAVAIIGVAVPLVFALGLSFILYDPDLVQPDINRGVFFLFLGVIFGTSALPVLARILSEYRLMSVRLGIFTMGVTTVDDLVGHIGEYITLKLT